MDVNEDVDDAADPRGSLQVELELLADRDDPAEGHQEAQTAETSVRSETISCCSVVVVVGVFVGFFLLFLFW